MKPGYDYIRDGQRIYDLSFATIRREANLDRFSAIEARVAVRMIHACGMVEIADEIIFSSDFAAAAEGALKAGKAILCDARMVSEGITRSRLPAGNEILCTLGEATVPALARRLGNTRSAAALQLWRPHLEGSLVAIGNAPTALFRLLELLDEGWPRPAAVIGLPVGFVGAAESKEALREAGLPYLTLPGRKGGSAMAVAAVNALASERE